MQNVTAGTKAFLASTATGILIFLFWDVMSGAVEPVEAALEDGRGGRFAWLAFLLTAGFAVGLMSLVDYDTWMKRRRRRTFLGPGAASTAEFEIDHHFTGMSPGTLARDFHRDGHRATRLLRGPGDRTVGRLGSGQPRDRPDHRVRAAQRYGRARICAPLAGDKDRPSWAFLGLLGLIGGAPTFFGTLIGQFWVNEAVSILFFALAAGLDPLCRDGAPQRQPRARLEDTRDVGRPVRPRPWLRHRLHSRSRRGLGIARRL